MALYVHHIHYMFRGIRHLEENLCYLSMEHGERFLLRLLFIRCLYYEMKYSHLRRLTA